jgi:carboxypeptidase Taq
MSNQQTKELYALYKQRMQKIADVKYSSAVLQWDQETYLPKKGAHFRAQQLATLSEVAHNMFVDKKFGEILKELNDKEELSIGEKKNISLSFEEFKKVEKFSAEFVRTMSEAVSESFYAWIKARERNEFVHFELPLKKLVELKRQEADILGYSNHPYNALMNEYEKGATVQMVDKIFTDVEPLLRDLLSQVRALAQPNDSFLYKNYPKDKQWEWGIYLAKQLNFDFEAGRQDISEHPFTTNFSAEDVRITTRIDENDFANMTWSTVHEVGHGLYEQGLPTGAYGLPLGEYTSLSIHESQSRLWENCIGRGRAFWKFYFPKLQSFFPEQFKDVSSDEFVRAINKVKPSLIRTEADELTYHFHVMIRYQLEKDLIKGDLQVKDIPAYWNEHYEKHLGVKVPDDKHGCLQDVHWSHGSFGYFATYSLGSFYAAQFWEDAKKKIMNLEQDIATTGETKQLLDWLRLNIHSLGKMYTSEELCKTITGTPLNSNIFVSYLHQKFKELYGL